MGRSEGRAECRKTRRPFEYAVRVLLDPRRLDSDDPDFARQFDALAEEAREEPTEVTESVAAILADIRRRGDAALCDYTSRFDRHDASRLAIEPDEVDAAIASCAPQTLEALSFAAARIRAFSSSLVALNIA